jgi:hypothetical protein
MKISIAMPAARRATSDTPTNVRDVFMFFSAFDAKLDPVQGLVNGFSALKGQIILLSPVSPLISRRA